MGLIGCLPSCHAAEEGGAITEGTSSAERSVATVGPQQFKVALLSMPLAGELSLRDEGDGEAETADVDADAIACQDVRLDCCCC
jgi:hypothetical protein